MNGQAVADQAALYIEKYRLALVLIPPGTKGPRTNGWNKPGGYITAANTARKMWSRKPDHGIGVVHEPSRTCCIDVDDVELTRKVFAELGWDYDALFAGAPLWHGRADRDKFLFLVPEGVKLTRHDLVFPPRPEDVAAHDVAMAAWEASGQVGEKPPKPKPITLFELRGGMVQDVLPPSRHPDTGEPYSWERELNGAIPEVAAQLLRVWLNWGEAESTLKAMCPWAEPEPPPLPKRETAGGGDVIGAYNRAHTVVELLEGHGYKRVGDRYLSPTSSSGLPGVSILKEGALCQSWHASDPLHDGKAHDAFDVFRILAHHGDVRAAVREAAEELGIPYTPSGNGCDPPQWVEPTPLPPLGGALCSPPYPLEPLPDILQEAAREVARFSKVPEASPAVIGLSVVATAMGKLAEVEERPGLRHHASMFRVLGSPSGTRKSAPFALMTHPLTEYIEDQIPQWRRAFAEVKSLNGAIDARLQGLRDDAKKGKGDLLAIAQEMERYELQRKSPPPHPRMFTTSITEERLVQKLAEHGGAYAVLSGEGRPIFDEIMGRYSGDNRTGDSVYLAGISGDTITRDRVGKGPNPESIEILRPALNVCGMVQPDKFVEFATHPRLRDSGAVARVWPVWLPSLVGTRIEAPDEAGLDEAKMKPFYEVVRTILAAQATLEMRGEGPPVIATATLSPAAAEARREFANGIERLLIEGGDLADVPSLASKAATETAKTSLVLHVMQDPDVLTAHARRSEISLATWAKAQALGLYHLTEATRVTRTAEEDPAMDLARRILAWAKRDGRREINSTTVMQFGPYPRPNAKMTHSALEILTDTRWAWPRVVPAGLRVKPIYDMNPALFSGVSRL